MIKSEYRTKALFPDRNAEKSADWLYCSALRQKGNMYAEYEDERRLFTMRLPPLYALDHLQQRD